MIQRLITARFSRGAWRSGAEGRCLTGASRRQATLHLRRRDRTQRGKEVPRNGLLSALLFNQRREKPANAGFCGKALINLRAQSIWLVSPFQPPEPVPFSQPSLPPPS